MDRILISGPAARAAVKAGADKLADAVKDTLGPFGTNALLEKGLRITNDGVKIAQEIQLDDEVENLGASKMKEAAAKANEQVGDGSTTIITLAQAILDAAVRFLPKEGVAGKLTTAEVLKKIKTEKEEILEILSKQATPITTEEELIHSATVSVEDETLGKLIGSAQWSLGENGYLLAEEAPDKESSVEKIHGVRIDNGFGASFVLNNPEKQMLEVEKVSTILTNETLQSLAPLEKLLNQMLKANIRQIAIVARGFSNEAIQACGENIKNGFMLYPINAPYTDSTEVMKDLASVLGGQFMDNETHHLEDMQMSDVGFAEKIRARRYDAIFTGKNDSESDKVQNRIASLKEQLAGSQSDFDKKLLQSRIAQLENGFALIKVGAESETERKRLFDKVEDAVNAVRAALQEGTVKGAGLAFKEIADSLSDTYILKRPLASLHEQIVANAPKDFVVEDWVRDPLKVLRIALEQACSVAGDLATVSTVVVTKKERYNARVDKAA